MKWRALAVVMAGLSAALGGCSFQHEWDAYCRFPGRCSQFDAGADASIQIAQGSSNRKILLTGQSLEGASVSLIPENAGSVSVDSVNDSGILLDVSVNHGIDAGTLLTVRFHWERQDEDQSSIPLVVTPITATGSGNDTDGFGTPAAPYLSLGRASLHSGPGDIIQLGAGTFDSICNDTSGRALKGGVTVEGLPDGGSVVLGTNAPGTCGFALSDPSQALRFVTISNFPVGLVSAATAGRPTAFQVTVQGCDAGVAVPPGGMLLLQQPHLNRNGTGLVSDAGDVVVQGGIIENSAGNGVLVTGTGGALSLTADVNNNAPQAGDDLTGAGVLIASAGGAATIGSNVFLNGHTGVTVAGTSNLVTFDGANLSSGFGNGVALLVKDPSAKVFLRGTTFQAATTGLKVEGLASLNGGTGDGGYGGNVFKCFEVIPSSLEIWDARTSNGLDMDFENTTIRGLRMDAGVDVPTTAAGLGIQIDSPTNPIHFH